MGPLVWLALAFVGFALFQVVLYRYLHGESPSGRAGKNLGARTDTGRENGPDSTEFVTLTREERPPEPDTAEITCTHCGADNERDSVYTYCRRCLEPYQ